MNNNKLILIILILILFFKMCNNKEHFDQNLIDNCKCKDNWTYWAPYSYDGTTNNNIGLEFNGCDNKILNADPTEEQWCYTVGSCPQNGDNISDSYQPFESKVNDSGVTWRRCKKTNFEDEEDIKQIIDNKFTNLSEVVGKAECRGRENGTCLNNFNTCVSKCVSGNSNRNKLLNELNQLMTCKSKMNDFVKKIDQANNGILLNGEINETLENEALEIIRSNCGNELSNDIENIYNSNKDIDTSDKNSIQLKDILLQNRSKSMKDIHKLFSDKTKNISKNYIDFDNEECKNSKAILISETNDNNCCKKEQNCHEFLENELNGNSVGKITNKCLRNSIDDYKSLNTCPE